MTAVILAAVLAAILPAPAYLYCAARWPQTVPLPGWVERLPAPPVLRLPRRKTQAPPRAHGGAGEPRTASHRHAHETGARRLTLVWDHDRGRLRNPDTTGPLAIITDDWPDWAAPGGGQP